MVEPGYSDDVKLEPFWWEAVPRRALPPPTLPAKTDVAIVGSGFTGLSAGLTLGRGGRDVTIFDAEDIGWGASTRNGGVIGGRMKISFSALAEKRGHELALAIYREGRNAHDFTVNLIRGEAIDCDLVTHGRFMGARTPKDFEAMCLDAERMHKHLGIETEIVPRREQHREVGSDLYHGGVVRSVFSGIHPARFHEGLVDRVHATGARLAPRTAVTGVTREREGFVIHTTQGRLVAREVIIATNGYTGPTTPWLRRRIVPIPSQIIVTESLKKEVMDRLLPKRRMMGDSCRLHHYFRPSPDGLRIMFGGRAGAAHLYSEMLRIFPELKGVRITHSWSGNTGYTFDTLPHIGNYGGMHYALGFCGSGVSMGTHMGAKIAQRILGAKDAMTAFDGLGFPTRPLYFGKPWFLPAALAYYGLRDRLGI